MNLFSGSNNLSKTSLIFTFGAIIHLRGGGGWRSGNIGIRIAGHGGGGRRGCVGGELGTPANGLRRRRKVGGGRIGFKGGGQVLGRGGGVRLILLFRFLAIHLFLRKRRKESEEEENSRGIGLCVGGGARMESQVSICNFWASLRTRDGTRQEDGKSWRPAILFGSSFKTP